MSGRIYSDDSEGTPLRDFVDDAVADEMQRSIPNSPRTVLLSSPGSGHRERSRRRRGPSDRYRKERERVHSGRATHELIRVLVNEEYELKRTRKVLYDTLDRLESEVERATHAEQRALEASQRLRGLNDDRITALQNAARANEELEMYKLQLRNAQDEILRAQSVLRTLESQRDDAEASAARARTTARKLNEERLMQIAREEGRRLGFEEGLRRGRQIGYEDGRSVGYEDGRTQMRNIAERTIDRALGDEQASSDEDSLRDDAGPPSQRLLNLPSPPAIPVPGPSFSEPRVTDPINNVNVLPHPGGVPATGNGVIPRPPSAHSRSSTNTTFRNAQIPQPVVWPIPEVVQERPSSRATDPSLSTQVAPDGYVPHANEDSSIPVPPPYAFTRPPSSPHSPSLPLPSTISASDSESLSTLHVPTPGPSFRAPGRTRPRRRSSPESQGSTTISQLDIVTAPSQSEKNRLIRSLSIIPEDASGSASPTVSARGRSIYSERGAPRDPAFGAIPVPPPIMGDKGRNGIYGVRPASQSSSQGRSGGGRDGEGNGFHDARSRDRTDRERNVSDPRYSDPANVDEWRRQEARSNAGRDGHHVQPSPFPPSLNFPPQPPVFPIGGPEHIQPRPVASQSELSIPGFTRGHSRRGSSGSSSVQITIQPPSRSPSDAPDNRNRDSFIAASDLLSPDHATQPLPRPTQGRAMDRREREVPTVPNTPRSMGPVPLDGTRFPEGFVPLSGPSGRPLSRPPSTAPPVIPLTTDPPGRNQPFGANSFAFPPQAVPVIASSSSRSSSSLGDRMSGAVPNGNASNGSRIRTVNGTPVPAIKRTRTMSSGSTRKSTPRSTYVAAPIPSGVSYPEPGAMNTGGSAAQKIPLPVSRTGSPGSESSRRFHTRTQSLNAGMTPGPSSRPLSRSSGLRREASNASMSSTGSYSRYNSKDYLDPAYLVTDDETVARNTAANAATGVIRTPRMASVSPALSYLTVPNM